MERAERGNAPCLSLVEGSIVKVRISLHCHKIHEISLATGTQSTTLMLLPGNPNEPHPQSQPLQWGSSNAEDATNSWDTRFFVYTAHIRKGLSNQLCRRCHRCHRCCCYIVIVVSTKIAKSKKIGV